MSKQDKTVEELTSESKEVVRKIRFLIAQAPVDHPNYLETAGHSRGFMTFRWVGERDTQAPLPKVTKLPLPEALSRAKALGGR